MRLDRGRETAALLQDVPARCTAPRSTTCCWPRSRRVLRRLDRPRRGCWSTWRATAARNCSTASTCPARSAGSPPSSRSRSDAARRRLGRGAQGGQGAAARGAARGHRLRRAALPRRRRPALARRRAADQLQLPRPARLAAAGGGLVRRRRRRAASWPTHPARRAAHLLDVVGRVDRGRLRADLVVLRAGCTTRRPCAALAERAGRRAARASSRTAPGRRRRPYPVGLPAGPARPGRRGPAGRRRPRRRGHLPADRRCRPAWSSTAWPTADRASTSSRPRSCSTAWTIPTLLGRGLAAGGRPHAGPAQRGRLGGLAEPVQVVHRDGPRARSPTSTGPAWTTRPPSGDCAALLDRRPRRRARPDPATADAARASPGSPATAVQVVWTFHHLLLDGWSVFQVLVRRVRLPRRAARRRRPACRPRRPVPRLPRAGCRPGRRAGRGALAAACWPGSTAPTPLPYDRQPAAAHAATRSAGAASGCALGEPTTARLHDVAQRHRLTLNTLVQGAWALLLARYSGQRDVVLRRDRLRPAGRAARRRAWSACSSTPAGAGRGGPRRRRSADWLRDLQAAQAEARQYEHVPLARLQTWSEVPAGGEPVRQHRGVRELPDRRRRGRRARAAAARPARRSRRPTTRSAVVAYPGRRAVAGARLRPGPVRRGHRRSGWPGSCGCCWPGWSPTGPAGWPVPPMLGAGGAAPAAGRVERHRHPDPAGHAGGRCSSRQARPDAGAPSAWSATGIGSPTPSWTRGPNRLAAPADRAGRRAGARRGPGAAPVGGARRGACWRC